MPNATRTMVAVIALALGAGAALGDDPRPGDHYGFLPLEIYKLDDRIANLGAADLDGDGVQDVYCSNNGRSRIDLLLTSKGESEDASKPDVNLVRSDRRMRLRSIPVNKAIVSVQAGDLDGDGRTDLAYYGTPAELIVLPNLGKGQFGSPRRFNTGEAVESGTALAVGDVDRDGKPDLALLTPSDVAIVAQKGGKLGDVERLPHTAGNPRMLKLVDLDGDGGDDLVILDGGPEDPIRVRFSTEGGKLGPEQRFAIEPVRAVAYGDLDGRKGSELLTIEAATGRAKVFQLADAGEDDADAVGRLTFYPLPKGDARGRSTAVGDLDGDSRPDVVVTDPAGAQFLAYIQGKAGLVTPVTSPGLAGGKTVYAADLDGDKKVEVVVLSEGEKQVGVSRFEGGRVGFPRPLPVSGDPVAMTVADLDGDAKPEILYAVPAKDGNDGDFELKALRREASGEFVPFRWGQQDAVSVKGLSGKPPALRVLDINDDKLADVLIFNAYGPPTLLLGRAGGEPPAPIGGSLGPLGAATPSGLNAARFGDREALLVAQGTFARDVELDKSGQWRIVEQFNSGKAAAQVVGAAALDTDGDGKPEVALMDKASRTLIVLDKSEGEGVYKTGPTLSVGPIDYAGMHVADLDGDGRDDLLIAGTDKFGVVSTGRKGQRFKMIASYEPERREARLGDLIVGDLNGDKTPDIALTDLNDHLLDLVKFTGDRELSRAVGFKVFEQKSFRDRDSLIEPRDFVVGDVDGDGRTDLVLMVHDRILVYRQDSGEKVEKTADKK